MHACVKMGVPTCVCLCVCLSLSECVSVCECACVSVSGEGMEGPWLLLSTPTPQAPFSMDPTGRVAGFGKGLEIRGWPFVTPPDLTWNRVKGQVGAF